MTEINEIHAIEAEDEDEPKSDSRIRDELEHATATIDAATGALRWQTDDAVLVTDARGDVVKTVLERGGA
jgi:hypothetical protein